MYAVVEKPMVLNPGDIVKNGRYKILEKLGYGGFGTTYKVGDSWASSEAIVALKQIALKNERQERDPKHIERLKTEARALENLEHKCIPKFFDSFVEGDFYYIVQEYIEGNDLTQEIRPGVKVDESEARDIFREILEILQFVHNKGIIHRDIKPANIIRRHSDSRLVLIDFGAVKEIATERTNSLGVTATRAIYTLGYTPTEQIRGNPKKNSDIYALGITIMQAVTGFSIDAICNPDVAPFTDREGNYIWQQDAHRISPRFKNIISRAIEYHSDDRYQTVAKILEEFNNLEPLPNNNYDEQKYDKPPQEPIKNSNSGNDDPNKTKWIKLFALSFLFCSALIVLGNKPWQKNLCNQLGDKMSCGEEIIDPLSEGSIKFEAARENRQKNYLLSSKEYLESWQSESRDAETLIYLNNSLLEASNLDYYTIAVAVPLSSNEQSSIKNSQLGQSFLRGVAQAQTAVNLSLVEENEDFQKLPGNGILLPQKISDHQPKGLKVVIVDDGNQVEQAQQTAKTLAKTPKLLGVIGNYASETTLATVDIYAKNNLAQISYGTTTKVLSQKHRPNFFRIVYTNHEEAEALVNYIQSIDIGRKEITGFYNPNSDFSNHLWIEFRERLKQKGITIQNAFNIAKKNFDPRSALQEIEKNETNILILIPDGQVTNSLSKAIEVIELDQGKSLIVGANSTVRPELKTIDTPQPINFVAITPWHPLSSPNLDFLQESNQLWGSEINNGTAMAYDAAITLIEALNLQSKPSRKGTIKELGKAEFLVESGATGNIRFNTPENGDRKNLEPTLIRLFKCKDKNLFSPWNTDDIHTENSACNI